MNEHFQGAHQGAEHQQLLACLKPHGIWWQLGENAAIVVVGVGVHNGRWRGGHFERINLKKLFNLWYDQLGSSFRARWHTIYVIWSIIRGLFILWIHCLKNAVPARKWQLIWQAPTIGRGMNGIFYANEIKNIIDRYWCWRYLQLLWDRKFSDLRPFYW